MTTIRLLAIIEATSITGPAKNLLRFAETARSDGFGVPVELSVITFQRGETSNLFLEVAKKWGIETIPVLEKGAFDRAVLSRLSAVVREVGPDLIQTHAVKSHFLATLAGLPKLAPWIAFHHGYTWPDLKARLYNQLDRWSLPKAARVVTVSMPFRQEIMKMGVSPERIEVVHNAIDPDWGWRYSRPQLREELRAKLGIATNAKVILIVGRLSKEKDHETLINAVGRLRRNILVRLVIVGEGPERRNIEEQTKKWGLDGNVTLTGHVNSAEPYYGIADVCVLSSLSEGSPNALLEAMAARVPIVATRVGGIPEIVTHRHSALLLRPKDPVEMAGALEEILCDSHVREMLVGNAHSLISDQYTPERRAQKLIEIYRRVLGISTAEVSESKTRSGL